jgi:hypothetical protein
MNKNKLEPVGKKMKKTIDIEDRSKPTHQRGPWMPKRSHKTCNAARDEA